MKKLLCSTGVIALGMFLAPSAQAALLSLTATGSSPGDVGFAGVVSLFRTISSSGGGNNGAGGGPFTVGRREVNWDAAGLDAFQTPGVMPNNFFNNNSKRGLVLQAGAGGSLLVSGRPASGSTDLRFSSLNPTYPVAMQSFSADRLFGLANTNMVAGNFFVPAFPFAVASVSAFGAVFEDVDLDGSSIEAFDENFISLGTVNVPVANNGLSFAGVYTDAGEKIASIRIIAGTGGLGPNDNPGGGVDMVAMDDFIYSEPQVIPEPSSAVALLGAFGALTLRRRRRPAQ